MLVVKQNSREIYGRNVNAPLSPYPPLFTEGTPPPLLPLLIVGSIYSRLFDANFDLPIYTWSQTQGVLHTCTHTHVPKSLKIYNLKGPFLQLNNKLVWKSLWKKMKWNKIFYLCSIPRGNNWIFLALSSWHWLPPWFRKYVYMVVLDWSISVIMNSYFWLWYEI